MCWIDRFCCFVFLHLYFSNIFLSFSPLFLFMYVWIEWIWLFGSFNFSVYVQAKLFHCEISDSVKFRDSLFYLHHHIISLNVIENRTKEEEKKSCQTIWNVSSVNLVHYIWTFNSPTATSFWYRKKEFVKLDKVQMKRYFDFI